MQIVINLKWERNESGIYFLDSGEPEYIEPQESIEMA